MKNIETSLALCLIYCKNTGRFSTLPKYVVTLFISIHVWYVCLPNAHKQYNSYFNKLYVVKVHVVCTAKYVHVIRINVTVVLVYTYILLYTYCHCLQWWHSKCLGPQSGPWMVGHFLRSLLWTLHPIQQWSHHWWAQTEWLILDQQRRIVSMDHLCSLQELYMKGAMAVNTEYMKRGLC